MASRVTKCKDRSLKLFKEPRNYENNRKVTKGRLIQTIKSKLGLIIKQITHRKSYNP